MANFNEHTLELSIMKLFKNEGYLPWADPVGVHGGFAC